MKENVKTCEGCPALCCRYIAVEFDKPADKEDFHHIRWFLMHQNVRVQIDDEGKWYVEFRTPCKNLDEDNLCQIHPSHPNNPGGSPEKYDEPQICMEHSPEECEFNSDGKDAYEHVFRDNKSFEEYVEKNMPEIINKEEAEDEVDLITLDEDKLDELISKLQELKETKEFEFEDSDGDDFAFELK